MSVVTLKPGESRDAAPGVRTPVGVGMDRVIETRRLSLRQRLAIGAIGVLIAGSGAAWLVADSANRQTVPAANLSIATVTRGTFDDFVPLRARVTPLVTVYLDSVEGGRIERVLIEDGAQVTPGQPLAVLSNATLQLDVIAREADVSQQLNNLRSQELELQRSRLENRRNLAEIEWQLRKAGRQLERDSKLAAGGWVSGRALRDAKDEARYLGERRAVTAETMATEQRLQASQLAQLQLAASGLTANLRLARASLDALTIRAPVAGQLSGFAPQVGQSLARGERLGQVDSAGRNKLVADIDEFYLGRVASGQRASVDWAGKRWPLTVTKIYPQVKNGSFTADLTFDAVKAGTAGAGEPAALQRGQTLQPRLTLGDPAPATLVANGAFYAESGGSFVFVVGPDGKSAEKRPVRLGRRNPDNIEVIGGLRPGDRVITSSYTGFADKTRLKFSGE
jgi:HlyD family secretion protein